MAVQFWVDCWVTGGNVVFVEAIGGEDKCLCEG